MLDLLAESDLGIALQVAGVGEHEGDGRLAVELVDELADAVPLLLPVRLAPEVVRRERAGDA
ncbi:MAG: hypothetical protein D6773_08845, partial [Alphaproteobacteria bacterium]